MNREWGEDPKHTILPNAWEYEIVGLNIQREPVNEAEPFLDLTVKRVSERRTLRFWSPQELEIERGGPTNTGGLEILDISSRGLERLGVRVADFEASQGAVTFVARAVEEIKQAG